MEASRTCVDMIAHFEGFAAAKYNDPAGHCTIGYGTLLHKGNCHGREGYAEGISEAAARALLIASLREIAQEVTSMLKVRVEQHQFDALCDFAYNLGGKALASSTLMKNINCGNFADVPAQFVRWDFAGGVEMAGLKRRRLTEATLWSTGNWRAAAATA